MKKNVIRIFAMFILVLVMPMAVSASKISVIKEGSEPMMDNNYGWTFNMKNVEGTPSSYHIINTKQGLEDNKVNGGGFDLTNYDVFYIDSEDDCENGKISMTYNNVGTYQGKQVNLKVSLTSCKIGVGEYASKYKWYKESTDDIGYQVEKASIIIADNAMQVIMYGMRNATFKYQFQDSNGKVLDISGYGTLEDLDYSQAFKFGNGVDKVYIYEDYSGVCTEYDSNKNCIKQEAMSHLKADTLTTESDYTKTTKVENAVQSSNLETYSDRKYKYAWATILFSGGSFDMTYYLGEPNFLDSWWADDTNNPTGAQYQGFGGGMFRFVSDSLVSFPIEDPVKTVDKTTIKEEEEFVYNTTHRIPYITKDGSDNLYTKYVFTDKLEPCLTVEDESKVIVKNDEGVDVTDKFEISLTTNDDKSITVKAIANSDFLSNTDFYGHEYQFIITTKTKKGYDLSPYLKKDKEGYQIPNVASIVISDKNSINAEKNTNKVVVEIPLAKEEVSVPDTAKYITFTSVISGIVLIIAAIIIFVRYKKQK